ncbi:MAG: glycosyltransferase [Erysipelotrichaceae bacterium]|nr:glycosyltransferase [Erysipelotrichaceae bacterium]
MINSCNINENFDSSNRIMFSIIVPVYQVEKYLNDCINSILNQSYKDYEIILVDDGSYDLSPIICDQYQNKYSNIKAIHKQNKGLSSARNIGLLNAKGDYILFIDSDDLWVDDVQILEKIAIKLNKYHCDVLIFNYKKFNSSDMIL